MKLRTTMLLPLILSAAFATDAQANYFHNPLTNINSHVGAAPNPTPQAVRENRLPKVSANSAAKMRNGAKEAQDRSYGAAGGAKTVASNSPTR